MNLSELSDADWALLADALPHEPPPVRYAGAHALHGKPSQLGDDLPLFRWAEYYNQNRRYTCPHCGQACTFSQLGHATRWGWCPHCDAGQQLPHAFASAVGDGTISRRELRRLLALLKSTSFHVERTSISPIYLSIALARLSKVGKHNKQ